MDTIEVSGPILYQKVCIYTSVKPTVVHMFGDIHHHSEKCTNVDALLTTTLVKNTLLHLPHGQVLFEGQPKQRKMNANYMNDFHGIFVTEQDNCWKEGSCSDFPGISFRSLDIRSIINSIYVRIINMIREDIGYHFTYPMSHPWILHKIKMRNNTEYEILSLVFVDSLVKLNNKASSGVVDFFDNWCHWISLGRPMSPDIISLLQHKNVLPIPLDLFVMNTAQLDPELDIHVQRWITHYDQRIKNSYDPSSKEKTNEYVLHLVQQLSVYMDIAVVRLLLATSVPYSIVYSGFEHHRNIIMLLKDIAAHTEIRLEHSSEFTNNNHQCIEIPVETLPSGIPVLLNNEDMYETMEHKHPPYVKYSGKKRRSIKKYKKSHKRRKSRSKRSTLYKKKTSRRKNTKY